MLISNFNTINKYNKYDRKIEATNKAENSFSFEIKYDLEVHSTRIFFAQNVKIEAENKLQIEKFTT